MKNLDYQKLQPLSANNENNKKALAKDNQYCTEQLNIYLDNFKEFLLSLSVYDMASLLIAEQDWLKRYNQNKVFEENLVGKIIRVDFGKMYLHENGLIHYAICIGEHQGKYCVVPMTTSTDEIKLAYHPEFRPSGEKRLYLLKKSDGNVKDSALYINDMKYISSGRIIKVLNKISSTAYDSIIKLIIEITFPETHISFNNQLNEFASIKEKNILLEQMLEIVKNAQK